MPARAGRWRPKTRRADLTRTAGTVEPPTQLVVSMGSRSRRARAPPPAVACVGVARERSLVAAAAAAEGRQQRGGAHDVVSDLCRDAGFWRETSRDRG